MQIILVVAVLFAFTGTLFATVRKANEYKSSDCSGPINFGHHSLSLGYATMDDSSHSVYLANENVKSNWEFRDGKTTNGGSCGGKKLGFAPHLECNNLDNAYSGSRVRCVRFIDS